MCCLELLADVQRNDAAGEVVILHTIKTHAFHQLFERFLIRVHAYGFGQVTVAIGILCNKLSNLRDNFERVKVVKRRQRLPDLITARLIKAVLRRSHPPYTDCRRCTPLPRRRCTRPRGRPEHDSNVDGRCDAPLLEGAPVTPEAMLALGNRWLLRRVLRRGGPAHNDAELEAYLVSFAGPGAMTAAVNYYRALFRVPSKRPVTIECPTLLIWGLRDRLLLPVLAEGTEAWVPKLERHEEPRARHWVQHDAAASVNARLLTFLSSHPSA